MGIAFAQNGEITGKINQDSSTDFQPVLISLFQSDATLARTNLSSDGSFRFEQLPVGTFYLSVDAAGFEYYRSEMISIEERQKPIVHDIVLVPTKTTSLQEVVVSKKKRLVDYQLDKTVVNVDAMLSNEGSDALDVLEKSPGILVDQNGTISFKGKTGLSVFIDDKPTYLSGAELEAYLKSLPAATLSQIELMSNPPAKYEAAGSAGVINIKTRKSKRKGFNGSVNSRVSQGKRSQSRNGVNLNFTNGDFRVYGNAAYATQNNLTDLYIFRNYKDVQGNTTSLFHQDTRLQRKAATINAKLGLDYYVSDKTTIGLSLSGLTRSGDNSSKGSSSLTDASGILDSTIVADNLEKKKFKNLGATLNFSHDLDSLGRKFTADLDFLTYDDDTNQRYRNFIYQPDNSLSSSDESRGELPSKINIYAFKTDYTHPLAKGDFGIGYKISYSHTDNIAAYADIINAVPIPNYNTSNHFKYNEIIHAAYANYNSSFGQLSIQAGLRVENTYSKGRQLGNIEREASAFKRSYTNLFPTFYAMYALDSIGNNQVALNYGKRIERPYYQDLNPFLSPLDRFTFYSGNPYLNPAFSHNLELSYRYKSLINTSLVYNFTKDNINETIEINDGIYYSRPGNIGKSQVWSWTVSSDFEYAKGISLNVYSEITNLRYKSELYTEGLDRQGTFFFISANNQFKFPREWSAEIGGRFISRLVAGQVTTNPKGALNLAVGKKILKSQGSLRLVFNDILYTNINSGVINNLQNTYADYENLGDTRFVALTFTYAFGKNFESKQASERSSSESEQSRVKS